MWGISALKSASNYFMYFVPTRIQNVINLIMNPTVTMESWAIHVSWYHMYFVKFSSSKFFIKINNTRIDDDLSVLGILGDWFGMCACLICLQWRLMLTTKLLSQLAFSQYWTWKEVNIFFLHQLVWTEQCHDAL